MRVSRLCHDYHNWSSLLVSFCNEVAACHSATQGADFGNVDIFDCCACRRLKLQMRSGSQVTQSPLIRNTSKLRIVNWADFTVSWLWDQRYVRTLEAHNTKLVAQIFQLACLYVYTAANVPACAVHLVTVLTLSLQDCNRCVGKCTCSTLLWPNCYPAPDTSEWSPVHFRGAPPLPFALWSTRWPALSGEK